MKLIVATDEAGGIGRKNVIPWKFYEDFQFFKFMTIGGRILIGRKTFDHVRLPSRSFFVLSSKKFPTITKDGYFTTYIDQKVLFESSHLLDDVWVCGGEQTYNFVLEHDLVTEIYKTDIPGKYNCDTFFHLPDNFELVSSIPLKPDGPQVIVNKFLRK